MKGSLGLVVLILVSGCSGGAPSKITGRVTLDRQPLADAQVQFFPRMAGAKLSVNGARTDAQGRFEIRPHPKTGVTLRPGVYGVFITKHVGRDGTAPSEEDRAMLEAAGQLKNLVPARYSDPEAAPLIQIEIKEGQNDLAPFELWTKDPPR